MRLRQRVTVEVVGQQPPLRYTSRLESLESEHLLLTPPHFGGGVVPLEVGCRLQVTLFDDGTAQTFAAEVAEPLESDGARLRITRPRRLVPVQRREHFREPAVLPIRCRLAAGSPVAVHGLTRNVSGGGLLMRTESLAELTTLLEQLPAGAPLWLELNLPRERLDSAADLRWWGVDEAALQADLAFSFDRLPVAAREGLIRFLFDHQRQALRKVS